VASLNQSRERLKAQALRIEAADALSWMAGCVPRRFELVFVDPPFDANLFEPALAVAGRLVAPEGFVYLEADREFGEAQLGAFGLAVHRHLRAGTVHAYLLRTASAG
jgi:16S rRNA G966 N2-methylase RsmD